MKIATGTVMEKASKGAREIIAVLSFIIGLLCHNSRIRLAHLIYFPYGDGSLTYNLFYGLN